MFNVFGRADTRFVKDRRRRRKRRRQSLAGATAPPPVEMLDCTAKVDHGGDTVGEIQWRIAKLRTSWTEDGSRKVHMSVSQSWHEITAGSVYDNSLVRHGRVSCRPDTQEALAANHDGLVCERRLRLEIHGNHRNVNDRNGLRAQHVRRGE